RPDGTRDWLDGRLRRLRRARGRAMQQRAQLALQAADLLLQPLDVGHFHFDQPAQQGRDLVQAGLLRAQARAPVTALQLLQFGPARPRTTALLAQDLVQAAGAVEVRARPWATAAADFLLPQGKAAPRRQAHAIVCRDQCFARVTGPAHLLDL